MKDQLRLLKELQTVDARATEVRKLMTALPAKLRPAREDLAKLEALVAKARADMASTEKWKGDQEEFIRREEDAVLHALDDLGGQLAAFDESLGELGGVDHDESFEVVKCAPTKVVSAASPMATRPSLGPRCARAKPMAMVAMAQRIQGSRSRAMGIPSVWR